MDELLQWCDEQRAIMMDAIRRMEAKEWRLREVQPGVGQVDQTQEWIAILKGRVVELDKILAACRKS